MDVLVNMVRLISDAFGDMEKLPVALILCGSVLAAAALRIAIFQAPEGVFFRNALVTAVAFGFMETCAGLWLRVTGDPTSWQTTAKIILGLSIFPLIIVAAIGGLA
ncbi:hypothetical protein HU200_028276 [Digitaria exilis]|uniref:Uncharacterized protein n=1 Tax=Digitaria exilis TaxID=1010633 RepID=A0A835ESX5_9POAL|nr:hypothetical protein HU200_028276 [Digitaria exilis]